MFDVTAPGISITRFANPNHRIFHFNKAVSMRNIKHIAHVKTFSNQSNQSLCITNCLSPSQWIMSSAWKETASLTTKSVQSPQKDASRSSLIWFFYCVLILSPAGTSEISSQACRGGFKITRKASFKYDSCALLCCYWRLSSSNAAKCAQQLSKKLFTLSFKRSPK